MRDLKEMPNNERVVTNIQGFWSRSDQCDACKQWLDEDHSIYFYRIADLFVCEDCHDDFLAGIQFIESMR